MATVKLSGSNTLGFRHRAFPAIFLGAGAYIGLGILSALLDDPAWCELLQLLSFVAVPFLYNIRGVRKERFAPAVFAGTDPLLPRNDLECWCASTFAIWGRFFDGIEGWPLICGGHKNKKFVSEMQTALKEDWDIHSREACLDVIHEMTARHREFPDEPGAGWDLCRATQLLGMMYAVNWLSRDELDEEFSRAGSVIQQRFHSWDALCESYLDGYAAWLRRIGRPNTEQSVAGRRFIFQQLKENKYGPYAIPWDTDLTWMPGLSEGASRKKTRRLLSRYQP